MDSTTWLPLATLIGGAALAYAGEWLRDQRQHRRDVAFDATQYAREERRRHRDWQRQVATDLIRQVLALYHASSDYRDDLRREFIDMGEWPDIEGDRRLPDEFSQALLGIGPLLALLDNPELSGEVAQMLPDIMAPIHVRSEYESADATSKSIRSHTVAMKRLGDYARSLSAGDAAFGPSADTGNTRTTPTHAPAKPTV